MLCTILNIPQPPTSFNIYNKTAGSALAEVREDSPCVVGPCHHGMARPQVADRGTASAMEGSCE